MSERTASPGGVRDRGGAGLNLVLFALVSLAWGGTWVATKVGVDVVPPVFFAALRYALVSAVLASTVAGWPALFRGGELRRTLATGVLVNVATYALLFWGMQFVPSGVSGLVNLALVPVGLFAFAILLGEERPRLAHASALALGIAGMAVLFFGKLSLSGDRGELLGIAAIVVGTASYCLGTVLARPLLQRFAPMQVVTAHVLIGTAGLAVVSLALEPLGADVIARLLAPAPLAGLMFLAFVGTIGGYGIYLRLVRDWGSSKAGLYAFVSPVVALILGAWLLGEAIGWREITGAAIMLGGAAVALKPARAS